MALKQLVDQVVAIANQLKDDDALQANEGQAAAWPRAEEARAVEPDPVPLEMVACGIAEDAISPRAFEHDPAASKTLAILLRAVDTRLNAMLSAVLHNDRVQALEGAWRGIERLVREPGNHEVFLKPATKADLLADHGNAGGEVESTDLYRFLVRRAYGRAGGVPYLFAVADFDFGPGPSDMRLAEFLAHIGSDAQLPFVTNGDAEFLVD